MPTPCTWAGTPIRGMACEQHASLPAPRQPHPPVSLVLTSSCCRCSTSSALTARSCCVCTSSSCGANAKDGVQGRHEGQGRRQRARAAKAAGRKAGHVSRACRPSGCCMAGPAGAAWRGAAAGAAWPEAVAGSAWLAMQHPPRAGRCARALPPAAPSWPGPGQRPRPAETWPRRPGAAGGRAGWGGVCGCGWGVGGRTKAWLLEATLSHFRCTA